MIENSGGEKLKTLRKLTGVSQKKLAIWLGCAPSSIPNYESGQSPIPFRVINKFVEANIPYIYFIQKAVSLEYVTISQLRLKILTITSNKRGQI